MTRVVTIHLLGPDDAGLLDRVAADVFDNPVEPARTRSFLAAGNHLMAVALADDTVVGMASAVVMQHPDKAEQLFVNEVGVGRKWRRKGIATRLMRAILDAGLARGCREAWLGTETDNAAARALYRRMSPQSEEAVVLYTFRME